MIDKDKLIASFERFKAESKTVTNAGWPEFNKRAEKYVMLLREAGLDSYYTAALTFWDAAGKRTLTEEEKL